MAEGAVVSYAGNTVWLTGASASTITFAPMTTDGYYYYVSWGTVIDPDMEMDIGL